MARKLLDSVIELAQQNGAAALYVSATPSASAVGFYQRQGFEPTTEPDTEMFALEPEDIHMVRPLSSS
jgi:ribosomal protein S18 acetylase RimI-like enzyme